MTEPVCQGNGLMHRCPCGTDPKEQEKLCPAFVKGTYKFTCMSLRDEPLDFDMACDHPHWPHDHGIIGGEKKPESPPETNRVLTLE